MEGMSVIDTAGLPVRADWAPVLPVGIPDAAVPAAGVPEAPDPGADYAVAGPRPEFPMPGLDGSHTLAREVALWGDRACDRMCLDAKVNAALHTLAQAILADGMQLSAAVQDRPDDPDPDPSLAPDAEASARILEACARAQDRLPRPPESILYELVLGALKYNSMLAEVTWARPVEGPDAGAWTLADVRPLPRAAWRFGIDPYLRVRGYFVRTEAGDTAYVRADKFLHVAWMPSDGDPRGNRVLDAAYIPARFKRNLWPAFADYVDKFGSPSLIGKTPPKALPQVPRDSNGIPVPGAPPAQPSTVLAKQLQDFRSSTVLVVSAETEVGPLEVKGEGGVFLAAFDLCSREVVHAILQVTRATEEAQYGSRADSGQAQDVLHLLVRIGKAQLASAWRRQVLRPLVLARFGPDAADRLLPHVQLGMVERADQAMILNAVANLVNSGALHPADVPRILRWAGLPVEAATVPAAMLLEAQRQALESGGTVAPTKGGSGSDVPKPRPVPVTPDPAKRPG